MRDAAVKLPIDFFGNVDAQSASARVMERWVVRFYLSIRAEMLN